MTDCTVRLPPLDELARRWADIEPLIERATRRTGCYLPIDVLQLAMRGHMGVWIVERDGAIDAALVTEVKQYPRRRILEVPFIGGRNLFAWRKAVVAALDAHAREHGCSHIAGQDRRGWARAGGFEIVGAIMVRALS